MTFLRARKQSQWHRAPLRLGQGGLGSNLILFKLCGVTLLNISALTGISSGLSCGLVTGRPAAGWFSTQSLEWVGGP